MPAIVIAEGSGGDGSYKFEVDINANGRPTALRCVNTTGQAAWGQVTQVSNGRTYGTRFANGTTEIAIPTGAAQRLQYTYDPVRQRFDGVETLVMWPYP